MELNSTYYIDANGSSIFIDRIWAFPDGTTHTAFARLGTGARLFLMAGRLQWQQNKLVLLDGGDLIYNQDAMRSAAKAFGGSSTPMAHASSTSGRVWNGSGGGGGGGEDAKVLSGIRNYDVTLPGGGAASTIEVLRGYDKNVRVIEFDLEITSIDTYALFRVYLNPGGIDVVTMDLTPSGVGGGHVKIVYQPGTELVVSMIYNGTWYRSTVADTRNQGDDRYIKFVAEAYSGGNLE